MRSPPDAPPPPDESSGGQTSPDDWDHSTAAMSQQPDIVHRRCVGADPCVEVAARLQAAAQAWIDCCDASAVGLARQAENYARLHELAPLPDEVEP